MSSINAMLLLVPVSWVLAYGIQTGALWSLVRAVLATMPQANLTRRATERLGYGAGPGIGRLHNVTFATMAGLIVAIFDLLEGLLSIALYVLVGTEFFFATTGSH